MNIFEKILKKYNEGFRQQHLATCGPASVILAAYALGLEMKKEEAWQNPQFNQWVPIDQFLIRGMALHELYLISQLIFKETLDIQIRRAYSTNISLFKQDLERAFKDFNSVIIINYVQSDVHASFNPDDKIGHYSPIADYKKKENKILVADVDTHVNKPYWVNIQNLYDSMSHVLPVMGLPRGWLVLNKLI